MLLNKKIWIAVLAAILITIVFFRYQTLAQNPVIAGQNIRSDSTDWNNTSIPQKYWLNNDQISSINDIKRKYDEKIQPQIEKLYNLRDEASQYGNNYNAENKKVKEYRDQIYQLEEQIYSTRLEARDEMNNILGKGQKPYYRDYAFNNWWSWDMDSWCNWDMNRCMMNDMQYRGGMDHDGCCGW